MLQANIWIKSAVVAGVVVIAGGTATAMVLTQHQSTVPHSVQATQQPTTDGQSQGAPDLTLNLPDTKTSTPTPAPSYTPPDNTAKCNQIVTTAKADLNSLYEQASQQLAIAKQIIANMGSPVYGEVNGSGVQGMINQSQTAQSAQQAEDDAGALSDKLAGDRESYTNQLMALSCYAQANTCFITSHHSAHPLKVQPSS